LTELSLVKHIISRLLQSDPRLAQRKLVRKLIKYAVN